MNPRNNQNTTESEFSKRTPESERRTTMKKLMSVAALLLVVLAAVAVSVAVVATMREIKEAAESMPVVSLPEKPEAPEEPFTWRTYTNEEYGFKIGYVGKKLSNPLGSLVAFRLDYGVGKEAYVFIDIDDNLLIKDIESPSFKVPLSEKVVLSGVAFQKDYWFHYEGMGQWDRGIAVYAEHGDHFYLISLDYPFLGGGPGHEVDRDGKEVKLTEEEIIEQGLKTMLDGKNEVIATFNKMLDSFQLTR